MDVNTLRSSGGGGDGDADTTAALAAVPGLLLGEVERADAPAGVKAVRVEEVGGDDPDDLEFEPAGVTPVEALGGAVVRGADERVRGGEVVGRLLQLVQRDRKSTRLN